MHIGIDNEIARSFATIREMIADRGADASSLESTSIESVVELARANRVFRVDAPSCGLVVLYDLNPKFKVSDVKRVIEDITAEAPTSEILLVVREPPAQVKGLDEVARATPGVDMFLLSRLQYNVSRHTRVPKHEPIRDAAAIEAVLSRYQLKSRWQLPLILSTDPMAKYLALKPGQLARITRFSPSAGSSVVYRCCIK
jgi:DNA-directed RNA polymerase I, II, and III subunit RPABC1